METSGNISFRHDAIRYEFANGVWELPTDRVRVIGEATTDHGPFLDDYWLCFATGSHEWCQASFYAAGREEFLKALSSRLGVPMELHLVGSTSFASRVLWPAPLLGKPIFAYADKWPSNPLLRAVAKLIGEPFRNVQTYSQEVEQYLRHAVTLYDKR
jgi:hypothetical protein